MKKSKKKTAPRSAKKTKAPSVQQQLAALREMLSQLSDQVARLQVAVAQLRPVPPVPPAAPWSPPSGPWVTWEISSTSPLPPGFMYNKKTGNARQ